MSEYKSPIYVKYDTNMGKMVEAENNYIVECVRKIIGIDVDKDRLIKALELDKMLVRCKDCKYWGGTPHNPICNKFDALEMYADDFCSRGEHK